MRVRRCISQMLAFDTGTLVGLARIELATSALSVLRSNRLSYSPIFLKTVYTG